MRQIAGVSKPLTLCASCGLPLRARTAICPSCGSLAPLERAMASLSRLGRAIARDRLKRLRVMAWGLALCPFLFVPPIAAIVIAWRAPSQRASKQRFEPTWITLVALLNLAVSAGVIHRFGPDLSSLMAGAQRMLSTPAPAPDQPRLQSI